MSERETNPNERNTSRPFARNVEMGKPFAIICACLLLDSFTLLRYPIQVCMQVLRSFFVSFVVRFFFFLLAVLRAACKVVW